MIKAIETIYNGYRFRSRLEARWAVFFTEMNIKYKYEYEGYERTFPDGTTLRYLPDFYFPESNVWGEVKGIEHMGQMSEEDAEKLSWMVDFDGPCSNGIILLGDIPSPKDALGMNWAIWKWSGKSLDFGYACDTYLEDPFIDHVIDIGTAPHRITKDYILSHTLESNAAYNIQLVEALKKARQARFEHGETPTIRR